MPKVSVIIPNYNHALFLRQRINSILNQTYSDYEVIILDDASTDNSREILAEYASNKKITHIVCSEVNSHSPFFQWKHGLDLSQGEYIWIAESDDWAEPTFLERLVPILDVNAKVGFAYSNSKVFEENKSIACFSDINNRFDNSLKWEQDYITEGVVEMQWLYRFCTVNNASAVLFRKAALLSIEIPTNFRFMGDWFVYVQIASSDWSIAYVAATLNNYRYHKNNQTKQVKRGVEYVFERFVIADYIIRNSKCVAAHDIKQILLDYTEHPWTPLNRTIQLYHRCAMYNRNLAYWLLFRHLWRNLKSRCRSVIYRHKR